MFAKSKIGTKLLRKIGEGWRNPPPPYVRAPIFFEIFIKLRGINFGAFI